MNKKYFITVADRCLILIILKSNSRAKITNTLDLTIGYLNQTTCLFRFIKKIYMIQKKICIFKRCVPRTYEIIWSFNFDEDCWKYSKFLRLIWRNSKIMNVRQTSYQKQRKNVFPSCKSWCCRFYDFVASLSVTTEFSLKLTLQIEFFAYFFVGACFSIILVKLTCFQTPREGF